ncbi:MAG: hypothetical protein VX738_05410 [Planctomycetota bacterium]|nr:hypothetical protein [Planctomycetota bacterium]
MKNLKWVMICAFSLTLPLLDVIADAPARVERKSDRLVKKRFSDQQEKNLPQNRISETEKKLQQQIDAVFFDVSLKQVLDSLSTRLDVQFLVDERALNEVGLGSDIKVHSDLRKVTAELALNLMLNQTGLTWFVRNDLVYVTTHEAAENELEIHIYPCQDFLEIAPPSRYQGGMSPSHMGGSGGGMGGFQNVHPARLRSGGPDSGGMGGGGMVGYGGSGHGGMDGGDSRHRKKTLQNLKELIPLVVSPDSWEVMGGAGSIVAMPDGMLVISQVRSVHGEVQKLLQTLRMMRNAKPDAVDQGSGKISETEKKLQQQIDAVFRDTPLREVLDSLSIRLDIQFYVEERALEEIGLDSNIAVHSDLRNVTAELALDLIMKQISLVCFVHNDLVYVTTHEAAESWLVLRVYPCPDFLERNDRLPRRVKRNYGEPKFRGGGFNTRVSEINEGLGSLIKVVRTNIRPDTWEELGGTGVIVKYGDMLIVAQNPSIQSEVENLLNGLRTAKNSKSDTVIPIP